MDLYLQLGWGMMALCEHLLKRWGGGTAILSPRDLEEGQLISLSRKLRALGGSVLLDPQFYDPRADHPRLTSHEYWPSDYGTSGFNDHGRQVMMDRLAELNRRLATTHLIVPGEKADDVDDRWLKSQRAFRKAALAATDQSLIATVCLSSNAASVDEQTSLAVDQAESASMSGYYLVAERPKGAYLVADAKWLSNVLDLAAALRRLGSNVVIGYSNHQQLIMACAGVNAIASGSAMGVRAFSTGRFQAPKGKVIYRGTWYYCPQALSEYSVPALDIGVRSGLKADLVPDPSTPYAAPLFSAPKPSASGWDQSAQNRHYLTALRLQAREASCASFDDTVDNHRNLLNRAGRLLDRLHQKGVRGQARDFRPVLDTNYAALTALESTQGPVLRRSWP